ncbi:monofunctional biosynthetic peptidoglycan transglycosylase [Methylomonas sp. AM2-LC]|uniref:monofunctional biosynthetic peptidoglycan transglycosylase n=1 Tax=Methylomonas sp. AM2-LC TaxID=3153301 RepID=UPI0032677965
MKHFRHPARYYRHLKPHNASTLRKITKGFGMLLVVFFLGSVLTVGVLRYLPVSSSAFMLHQHWVDMMDGKGYKPIDQQWVNYLEISTHAFTAVIASEDQLFYQHNGFDFNAIQTALNRYIESGRLRGASTISQQVAKNLFLTPDKTFFRKGLEVWFTVLIESMWSKTRILEVYLNIAEFGDHIFGIEAASRRYFGVPAKQLTVDQSAMLAATLPNPLLLKANQPSAYLFKRQSWILNQMRHIELNVS